MQARAISEFTSQLQLGETGKPKESEFRASGASSFVSVAQSLMRETTPGDGGDTETEATGVTVELGAALPKSDAGSDTGTVTVVRSHSSLVIRSYTDQDGNQVTETARTDAKLRATGTSDAPPVIEIDLPDPTFEPPKAEEENALPPKDPAKLEVAAPKADEDSDPAPKVEDDTVPAPKVEDKADPAPKVEDDADPAPKAEEDTDPTPKVDDDADPAPKAKDEKDPAPKVPGGPKQSEDLTITDRPVDRLIGNKVGDLTTGAYDDTVTITNGGPRTVDTGAGFDNVTILEGEGNIIHLGKGNDYAGVSNTARNTSIYGGEGHDVVDLDGKYTDFDYTQTGENSYVFTRKDDPSIKTTVDSAELVIFADGTLENGTFTPSDSANIPLGKKLEPITLGGALGSQKEPEDLTITERPVDRQIGQLVGDLTTGDFDDDITITAGGPRTVKTGDGYDFVEVLGGADNKINLGKGDDSILVSGGNNTIDGGEGSDTVFLSRNRDDYKIDAKVGNGESNTLVFTNKTDGTVSVFASVNDFEFANGELVTFEDLFDEILFRDNLPE